MRLGETPVPIPNTTVKPQTADGTMLETAWESRRVPEFRITRKWLEERPPPAIQAHEGHGFGWLMERSADMYLENSIQKRHQTSKIKM